MSNGERDYYEVLGISRDADAKAVKQAYHRLAMKWHPDRNRSPEAEERFKEIAKAYAILSDPAKRARYDAAGFEGVAHFSFDDLFRDLDLGGIFGDTGLGAGGGDLFDRFFHAERPRRGLNLRVSLNVALERIDRGGAETVRFVRPAVCATCGGFGTRSGKPPEPCRSCDGTGRKVVTRTSSRRKEAGIRFEQVSACGACGGSGRVVTDSCRDCGGEGRLEQDETIRIDIPRGIEDGTVLRVPAHGLPGETRGAPPGDLLVGVYTAPDSRFERRGADLWRTVTVDVTDAVLGTTITVPTLSRSVSVKVPAGTQPEEVLRLGGKGLPRYRGGGRGDLKLRIRVRVPEHCSERERELYRELKALRRD